MTTTPESSSSSESAEPRPVYVIERPVPRRSSGLFWLLIALVVFLAIPYLVQHITYGLVRGREMAKADAARKLLDELPDEGELYPWVAKSIEPAVVGVDVIRNGKAPDAPAD